MDSKPKSPFENLKRRRLPGMHMITAADGGMPLREALAAFFFMTLHDRVRHTCLIKQAQIGVQDATNEATRSASTLDGMALAGIFGIMAESSLTLEEWSYLSDEDAFAFYLMADAAIEQTQRWISQGVEEPMVIPRGALVQRPEWALKYYAREAPAYVQESRETVERLRREVESATAEQNTERS